MPSIRVNEAAVEIRDGMTILEALRHAGVTVPTLCHDDRLAPMGGCRLCVVEVRGQPRPVPACTTPAVDGMAIETHTAGLEEHRRTLLELLAGHYPAEAVSAAPEKEFHQLLRQYGVVGPTASPGPVGSAVPLELDGWRDGTHPYLDIDMRQCVTCLRCVRICDEVQGQNVWQILDRGDRTRIRPDSGTTLLESSCVSCGACVDTCPTGALEDRSIRQAGVPDEWVRTTCSYCGTGCEMEAGVREDRLVAIRPVRNAPVNAGHLCVKGRYSFGFVDAPDRVTSPMIRSRGGEWRRIGWPEATSHLASELRRIRKRYGADAIGLLGSARATNEENYVAQKFARLVLGTNNVDCCARVCHAPTAEAMKQMLGTGAATNSFDDIERARTILVVGSNATENHPIVGARIRQAARRGANLIVIDPRRIEIADEAHCHLRLHPGTNTLLLNALAATIVEEDLVDHEFLRKRVDGFEHFREFLRDNAPERVSLVCGVEAAEIRRAARMYATARPSMCFHGLGVTEHIQGTEGVMCLVNLALLTGNLGRPGTGINPLRGQNNVQGSAQMGCAPGSLTGGGALSEGRERFEAAWRAPLPETKGLDLLQMMDAAAGGTFKALWTIGYDVLMTNADMQATRKAFNEIECVVVQDLFLNETAREFGTLFLPAASSFEKDGTFMNAERRIQRIRQAIEPRGESRSDWEILCGVAREMGAGALFPFGSAREIWDEIRQVWPAVRGMTWERLEENGLQWPCPAEDHPGTAILHRESFPLGERASVREIEYRASRETVSEDYPMRLITGRTLYHFNAGTMTGRSANHLLEADDLLDVAAEDAERLNLSEAEPVVVESRHGAASLRVRISDAVRPGELFCTFHAPDLAVNAITGPGRDLWTNAPEYKVTAVRLRKS